MHSTILFLFYKVDLRHEEEIHSPSSAMYNAEENSPTVDVGIDLTEFYMSVEWDILEVSHWKKTDNIFFI